MQGSIIATCTSSDNLSNYSFSEASNAIALGGRSRRQIEPFGMPADSVPDLPLNTRMPKVMRWTMFPARHLCLPFNLVLLAYGIRRQMPGIAFRAMILRRQPAIVSEPLRRFHCSSAIQIACFSAPHRYPDRLMVNRKLRRYRA